MKIPINLASQPFRRDRALLAASIAVSVLLTITLGVLGVFVITGISTGLRKTREQSAGMPKTQADFDRRAQILRLLSEKGPLTSYGVAAALGFSQTTTWRILEGLVKEGRLKQTDTDVLQDRKYYIP